METNYFRDLRSEMFAISMYISLIYLTVICHVLHKRDNTYNKITLIPYYIIFLFQIIKVITYAVFLIFDISNQSEEISSFFSTLAIYLWSIIALWQFFIWDLITNLVKFQEKYQLS